MLTFNSLCKKTEKSLRKSAWSAGEKAEEQNVPMCAEKMQD